MSSLPGIGCYCGHAFPWPYSASVLSVMPTSSFDAQCGSPHQERALGVFLGCGPPPCNPAWTETAYMESGLRTNLLALCSLQGRAGLCPEPALQRARMVPVPLCGPLPPGTICPKVWLRKHWPILLPPFHGMASPHPLPGLLSTAQ